MKENRISSILTALLVMCFSFLSLNASAGSDAEPSVDPLLTKAIAGEHRSAKNKAQTSVIPKRP